MGPKRADTAGSTGPGRSTRYEKRQDAKAQRRKAAEGAPVAEGDDSGQPFCFSDPYPPLIAPIGALGAR